MVPAPFVVSALAVLVSEHFDGLRPIAVLLAALTLLVAIVRARPRRCDTDTRDRRTLASELPAAIAHDELEIHFQPKAETVTGFIIGMEALVRWRHPQRGLLAPCAFVPLAEQIGVVRELTQAVMTGALAQCRRWQDAGHKVPVAVNVSFTDLQDADFVLEVVALLAEHGVEPESLIIEVTESSIMSDARRVGDSLARLSEFGVRISLDDFGTGYSSLTHLRTLPVSEVKVDRSFVGTMREDSRNAAIVHATVQLAHNLGLEVVAEGVEDDATRRELQELGCDLIQGYLLARPMPPDEANAFLAGSLTHAPAA
jgi:EAL domain-containing protein (putative c-di-GMP-specific phosphodiesterase class I)